jgi:predicted transglutaminase-like cysteine proteinase
MKPTTSTTGIHRIVIRITVVLCSLVFLTSSPLSAASSFKLDPQTINNAEKKYGSDARKRLLAWQTLIHEDNSKTDIEKLTKVNHFFNKVEFISDPAHWGKKDYWATPVELLASDGGDCEDFSLAKYFTLKLLGIPESRLNLTYVKALKLNQAHMVMTYLKKPGAEPLILDNLIDEIKPSSQRTDLLPVYSFNGSGLWIAKQRGRGKMARKTNDSKRWLDLQQRMPQELL